jgi:hypothetical protein
MLQTFNPEGIEEKKDISQKIGDAIDGKAGIQSRWDCNAHFDCRQLGSEIIS